MDDWLEETSDLLMEVLPLKDLVEIILDYLKEDLFFYQVDNEILSVNISDFSIVNRYDASNITVIKYFGNGKLYFVMFNREDMGRFLVSYLNIGYYDLKTGRKVTMLNYESKLYSQTFVIYYKGKIYTTNHEFKIVVFDATTDQKLYNQAIDYTYKGTAPIIYQDRIYIFNDGVIQVYDLNFNLLARYNIPIVILKIYQGKAYAMNIDHSARNKSLLVYDINNFRQIGVINENIVEAYFISTYKDILLITDDLTTDMSPTSEYQVKIYNSKTYKYLGSITDKVTIMNYYSISVIGDEICYNGDMCLVFKNILTGVERKINADGYILYAHKT